MESCSSCGAVQTKGAEWCNQCFAPVGASAKPARDAVAQSVEAPPVEPVAEPEAVPAPKPSEEEAAWQCTVCEEVNPLTVERCPICGTSIYESFGSGQEDPPLSQGELVQRALIPGWAHGSVLNPVAGILVGSVIAMSLIFGLMIVGTSVKAAGIAVLLWAFGLWVFSIWDAHQSHYSSKLMLQPKIAAALGVIPVFIVIVAIFTRTRA